MATPTCSTILPFIPTRTKNNNQTDNNYYYIRAREDTESGVQMVAEMYMDALGRPMPRYVEHEVLGLMEGGIAADMICAVLAYTMAAPRPSWVYARTVIERQAAMGARTAADFNGNVASWRTARAQPKAKPLQYEQREYGPEYDEIPPEQLEAMRHG